MTIELYALLGTALLLLVVAALSGAMYGAQVGQPALMGNRAGLTPPSGAADRARRAHQNLLENAVPFACVVLIAHMAGVSTPLTQAAAAVFFAARVIHALVYVIGIPVVRTLAWLVGVVCTILLGLAAT